MAYRKLLWVEYIRPRGDSAPDIVSCPSGQVERKSGARHLPAHPSICSSPLPWPLLLKPWLQQRRRNETISRLHPSIMNSERKRLFLKSDRQKVLREDCVLRRISSFGRQVYPQTATNKLPDNPTKNPNQRVRLWIIFKALDLSKTR